MANTIKRTVNISYQAEGLEKIQQQAQKIELFGGESQTLENLFKRIQALQANLAKQAPEGVVSPELATEFGKEYSAIIADLKKARLELIALQDKESAKILESLEAQLDGLDKQISKTEQLIEKTKKQITEKDGVFEAGTKTLRGQVLTEARGTALAPDEEMRGISGRDMKNVAAFLESLEKAEEVLGNIDKQYVPIVQKIKEGKELNQEEIELLNKAKEESKQIGLNAEEMVAAFDQRKRILAEEQNILRNKRAESLADLETTKKQLEADKQILETKRNQIEATITDPGLEDNQQKLDVLIESFEVATKAQEEFKQKTDEARRSQKQKTESTKESTKAVKENNSTLARATRQVFNYGIAFTALRRIYRETLTTIRDLDKALTEMAIVTTMNRKQTWELVGTMQQLAKETGFTTTEIAKLSTVYFRQGRTLSEVIELTRVAAQAARIAGISAGQSADFLTSAVNAFQLSADQALGVSDRFAALASQSASSYEELALGLSKFAAQANVAGISIDFAMGLLAKGVETTREAPETIGTALKTVIARMRELTDLGKTFEDGMDINRVEVALRQVGVALRDSSGQFRDMESVLTDVGMRWDTLNANQQASIAVSLAGTRQQSRLIAIMSGFDRTLELVNISQNSAGATMAQHTEFMKGMEAATVGLQNAYQKFITTITESEIIIGIVRGLGVAIEAFANGLQAIGFSGQVALTSILALAGGLKAYNLIKKNSILFSKLQFAWQIKEASGTKLLADAKKYSERINRQQLKGEALLLANRKLQTVQTLGLIKTYVLMNGLKTKTTLIGALLSKVTMSEALAEKVSNIQKEKSVLLQNIENKSILGAIIAKIKYTAAVLASTIATKGFTAAVLSSPLAPFALAIIGIVGAFVLLKKGFEDNEKGIATFAGSIAGLIKSVFEAVKGLGKAFMSLFKVIAPFVKIWLAITFAPFVIGFIKIRAAIEVLIPILDGLTAILNSVIVWFYRVGQSIEEGFIRFIDNLIEKIPGLGQAIEGLQNILESVGGWWSSFKDAIKEVRETTERELMIITSTYDELASSFTDNTQKMQGELFNLRRAGRTLEEFNQRLIELQTTGDEEGIEKLINDIKDINEELIVFDSRGNIDFEKTAAGLIEAQEENLRDVRNTFRDIYDQSKILMEKDFDQFLKDDFGELSGAIEFFLFEEEERRISNDLDALTDAQNDAFRKYVRETAQRGKEVFNVYGTFFGSNERQGLNNFLNTVEKFESELLDVANNLDSTESRFARSIAAYRSSLSLLSGDSIGIASFEGIYSEFSRIVGLFGNDAEQFADIFDTIGFEGDRFDTLAIAAEEANIPIQNLFESIQNTLNRLDNVPEPLRMTTAIAEVARTTEDAALAMTLFGSATERTVLEITQSADLLASRIKRLGDQQEKFLSGEISDQELFELIENYRDFFADEKFFNDFVQGRDLSIRLLQDEINIQYEYQQQLILTRAEIQRAITDEANYTSEQIQGLRSEEARLMLLTRYRGELSNVTREQNIFNQTLKAYNNLVDLGFKNIGLQARAVEALRQSAGSTLSQIQDGIQSITRALASRGIDESIVRIVDGVAILQEGFSDLDSTTQQFVERLLVGLEDQLTAMREFYSVLASESIALEKELADQKIKVYQDYFAALDRLEEQRRRAVAREDLVSQLARLEGATDERSRKRALELRRQLNQVDEDTAQKAQEASRASMIATINEGVERLQQAFESAWNEFINSAGDAGENMGEELFNVLQRYGLVGADQQFDLGELLVKADDSFSIPDPTTELAQIAAEAAKLEVEIGKLNGVIAGLGGKIADLKTAIESTTDPELKAKLKGQLEVLEEQRNAAVASRNALVDQSTGLAAQFEQAKITADRLGIKTGDEELAAAKHLNALATAVSDATDGAVDTSVQTLNETLKGKDFSPTIQVPEPTVIVTPVVVPISEDTIPTSDEPVAQSGGFNLWEWIRSLKLPPIKAGVPGFSQGGMVDFTGPSMLHGSRTSPEAVLNPEQTQMFMGLRDALSNISLDGEAGSSINIEEIVIKTDSMNNNQDFNRAGEALAEAFQSAINRRGVTINTKR